LASVKRSAAWLVYALVLLAVPLLLQDARAVTLASQAGIAIIACLAFNLLFGHGGMVSFGHAMYAGIGAYATMHLLRILPAGASAAAVALLPLAGGAAALLAGLLLGYLNTRRSGITFAMITLGLAELAVLGAAMFPAFFGGEAGLSGNRVAGRAVAGVSLGPGTQMLGLIAAYTLVCTVLLAWLMHTPFGRLLHAVRDNAQRVPFIGYRPQRIRHVAFTISALFMGISGSLAALLSEIVTPEVFSLARSGALLMFVFIGGAAWFAGPIVGAVLMVGCMNALSTFTPAWLLYLGMAFIGMVIAAPRGLVGLAASLSADTAAIARHRRIAGVLPHMLAFGGSAALAVLAASAAIEMLYRLRQLAVLGAYLPFLGMTLDVQAASHWIIVLVATAVALVIAHRLWPGLRRQWTMGCAKVPA
jgi:branched-chain amino acid transport system permease protein